MHEPGVVADEQRAASQHRTRGKQIELADQVDLPMARDRRQQRFGLTSLVRGGQHCNPRSCQRAVCAGQALCQLGKTLGAPLLSAPVRGRADRQDRSARRDQRAGRALMMWRGPHPRIRRRVEIEQPAELMHAVLARIALGHHPALACPQQP